MMKVKGNIKNAGKKPNFWGQYEKTIPQNIKEMIYDQYYNLGTMYVYCDCSMQIEYNIMSIACSYIQNGSIMVKSNVIYPPNDCRGKNTYGELQAVMSSLFNFEKQMNQFTKKIVIYSDVDDIIKILNHQVNFKKVSSLMNLQTNLIQLFDHKRKEYPNLILSIVYLSNDLKTYNPFAKSARNAARKIIQQQI